MLRSIVRISAPFTLILPAAFAWLFGGCSGRDVTVATAYEPEVPSFTAPDADVAKEAGDLVTYCPSNKCPPGWTTCPNSRFPCDVNLRLDPNNCGACGFACHPGTGFEHFPCVEGACVMKCNAALGALDCDGVVDNGCEARNHSNDHCGACGNKCTDPAKPCVWQDDLHIEVGCGCPDGKLACGGRCVDVDSDDANCGACKNQCDPTGGGAPTYTNTFYGCRNGACGTLKCRPLFADCDGNSSNGCETSVLSDDNCGDCGMACPAGQACHLDQKGNPTCMCPDGQTFCETECQGGVCKGRCVDVKTDTENCGSCGVSCLRDWSPGMRRSCDYGACVMRCDEGFADCNNSDSDGCEIDTSSDPRNCGACGNACDAIAGQACVAGRCVVEPCDEGDVGAGAR